jgi:exosortase/archaeosortase family protein
MEKIMGRVFRLCFGVLVLPVSEVYFFRWLFHRPFLNIRPGLPGFVDADLVLPGFFASLFLVFLLDRERPLRLVWDFRYGVLNFFAVAVFAGLSLGYPQAAGGGFWWLVFMGMVITGLWVRLPPRELFANRHWPAVIPCAFIASSLIWVKRLYEGAWPIFGVASAETVCSVLRQWDNQTRCRWVNPQALALIHPEIKALFGPPCSGVDALFLFLITTSVYVAIDPKRMNTWQTAALFLGSVATAFALNVLRTVSIFVLSLGVNSLWGSQELGMDVFVAFFHAHAGWCIYSFGAIAYFYGVERIRQRSMVWEWTGARKHA